ncbi:hypothetical protein [Chengkuizengella axinellae]|uniref:Deoxynucleoside kinase domain-containing protein n=1 Tax=Chengkuizengella axinellae TaxID=3064388 RepID=A0ABT9J2L4_9BACL|nr:hypothetical protein [Chengkuizengella sp. 2205SS18-9]MDP5275846.1 hypothetical protein [Chengkuizengella sp. 2205SS18-9]
MLVFLEGLPGVGKSTNSGLLYRQFERNGFNTRWVPELERSHPVLFFHEAYFSKEEYQSWKNGQDQDVSFMDRIAQVREDSVGIDLLELSWNHQENLPEAAFQKLREKNVWNFSLEKYIEVALEKWKCFAKSVAEKPEQVVILDSCIFQYQIFSFQLENAPKQALDYFIETLWGIVKPLNPKLVYLHRESVTDAIDHLIKARGESFIQSIWKRDRQRAYYNSRPDQVETYFEFLADYHQVAHELFEKAPCPKLSIEVTSAEWGEYEHQLLTFFDLTHLPDPTVRLQEGEFSNQDLVLTMKIKKDSEGFTMTDPEGNNHRLHSRSEEEFYIHDMPVILNVPDGNHVLIKGISLINRWTETGIVFKRIRGRI